MSAFRRLRTTAQNEASRINSKHSTGPRTAAGKANSCLNAFKHGFTSKHIVKLSPQMAEYLSEIHHGYQREFNPVGQFEIDMVRQIADAVFMQRYLQHSLDIVIEHEIKDRRQLMEKRHPGADNDEQAALAFRSLANGPSLHLFLRYQASAERTLHRGMKALREAQRERFAAEQELQAEPTQSDSATLGFVQHNSVRRPPQNEDTPAPEQGTEAETPPRIAEK